VVLELSQVVLAGTHVRLHRWYPDHILLDPYAPLVAGRRNWAARDSLEKFKKNVSHRRRRCCMTPACAALCADACVCAQTSAGPCMAPTVRATHSVVMASSKAAELLHHGTACQAAWPAMLHAMCSCSPRQASNLVT
jgi:hypothetical protein